MRGISGSFFPITSIIGHMAKAAGQGVWFYFLVFPLLYAYIPIK